MKKQLALLIFALVIAGCIRSNAQQATATTASGFTDDLSHREVFIENLGQVDEKHANGNPVLFETSIQGTNVYFTRKGVTAVYAESYLPDEFKEEMEEVKVMDADDELAEKMQVRYHYLTMQWQNTAGAEAMEKVDETPYYFTYPNNRTGNTVVTRGYKKIIYKNIYPNIDAEYLLPEEGGLKYNLILHPGADISAIKMLYDADKISSDNAGNLKATSEFLTIIEQAPKSFYEDNTAVNSSFQLNSDNTISFSAQYQASKTLIIDPWVTLIPFMPPASILPGTQPVKTGFDVCYDNAGNVYVYGGASPYHAMKFSPGGALLWDSSFPDPIAVSNAVNQVAGDMEVDKRTGSVYVSEGFGGYTIGASIYKLNTAGVMVAQMNGMINSAFSNHLRGEISRLRLDYCTNLIHMTCGGVPVGSKQVAQIDTAFSVGSYKDGHITVSNNGDHDVCLMALDPNGQYMYANFNRPCAGSPDFLHDNEMHKIPLATYNPSSWIHAGPIYTFEEISSLSYAGWSFPTSHRINMFNGMVCGNNFLFTNDGKTVKKWNKNTGALIGSVATGGKMFWSGGMDLDNCENLYVSVSNAVKVYDSNLSLINTIALPDTSCYDLKVDVSRKLLYATGNKYVTAIPINIASAQPQISVSSTPASNCSACNGTASALAVAPSGCDTLSFNYNWTPGGQTTPSVSGLCAGTYSVRVAWTTLAKCSNPKVSDTLLVVTIAAPQGALAPVVVANNVKCYGANNGTASVSATGGTAPYTYNWSTGQAAQSVSGLAPGNYSVMVTDASGCSGTQVFTISQPAALSASITATNIACNGLANGSATLGASGGTPAYSYAWSNGQNAMNATGLTAGNYNVTTTDANGCTATQSVTITEPTALVVNITSTNILCFGNSNGASVITTSGGTPAYSYNWSNGLLSSSASGLAAGNYVVTIADANGCTQTHSVSISQPAALSLTVTPTNIPCNIGTGSAFVTTNGGTPAYSYNWSNGQQTSNVSGLAAGNYTVGVVDANGCASSQSFSISSSPAPVAAFAVQDQCLNVPSVFQDNSTGNPVLWFWDFGDGNTSTQQNPGYSYLAPGTYTATLIASLGQGCSDTTQQVVTIYPLPVPSFSAAPVCVGNTTEFSDLSFIANGTITSWNWSFGHGATSTQQNPVYTFVSGGNYNVTLTVTSADGCTASATTTITVHKSPLANFNVAPLQQPTSDPVFSFSDLWSGDVTQWMWYFGDGSTNGTLTHPVHSYSAEVTSNDFYSFEVCLNVQNQFGCWDSICKTVELIPEYTFYIPNTFTPNGDFSNDYFFGKGRGIKEYQIWIFDRWGNLIWDCHQADANVSWDNKGNDGLPSACKWSSEVQKGGQDMSGRSGQGVQEDVYVWKVALKDIFDRQHDYIGNVNVVR